MTSLIPQGFYTHFLVKGTELISDDSVNLPLSCDGDSESSRGEVIVGECKIVLDDNLSVLGAQYNFHGRNVLDLHGLLLFLQVVQICSELRPFIR